MVQNEESFIEDFDIEKSQIIEQKQKRDVRNLNKEFEKIKTDRDSDDIKSFKNSQSKKETSYKMSEEISSY